MKKGDERLMTYFKISILFGGLFSCLGWSSSELIKQLLEQNRLEEALPICRQYEILPTRDDKVNFACAWVYYRTFRPDAARAILEKSKNSSNLPEYQLLKIYGQVANLLIRPESVDKLSPEERQQYTQRLNTKISESQKLIQNFLEQNKTHPMAVKAKEMNGEFYELKGQLEPAAFIYRGIIGGEKASAIAHWGLGRYYLAQGDIRRAKSSLKEVALMWPKHISCRYNLALLALLERGPQKNDEAAKWLTEAFKLNQSDAAVLEQIGVLLEANGKALAALKYWKRALEINPKSSLAQKKIQQNSNLVVQDLISQEKWQDALATIRSFTDSTGETPEDLLVYEGIAHRRLGSFQKAGKIFRALMEKNPSVPLVVRELGICELNMKKTDEAISLFKNASRKEKNEGLNFAWLGFAFEAKKDYWKAAEAWNKAASLFKDTKEIRNALTKVVRLEQKMGRRFIASENFEKSD